MGIPYITAHSGCEHTPRDSMDAIERAVALGADIVEMDIRRAPDGVLRISHDPLGLEEYGEKVLLEDVFQRLKDTGLSLNCDMKEAGALYPTLDMAAACGFGKERLILSGCTSPEQIARDPSLVQRARIYVNVEELVKLLYFADKHPKYDLDFGKLMTQPWKSLWKIPWPDAWTDEVVQFAQTFQVQGINLPFQCLTDDFAEKMRASKVPFSVWTVNDPADMERCMQLEAENITTLEVSLALETRGKFCKSPLK